MSRLLPTPIARRALLAGAGFTLAAAALPAGVIAALAAETPSTADLAALPTVFDAQAFCDDLINAGCRITAHPRGWGSDGMPGYFISPGAGRGRAYCEVVRRWSDAMDACPDHVERVVRYALKQAGAGL